MNNVRRRTSIQTAPQALPFIITVVTTSANETFTLPLVSGGTYNFEADWGDLQTDQITTFNQPEVTHTYANAGTYDITMTGDIEGWAFNNTGDKLKIIDVKQWGGQNGIKFIGNGNYFSGCSNLEITATDSPNLSLTTSLSNFFANCSSLTYNASINNWNVSNISLFDGVFFECSNFNQNVQDWDLSNASTIRFIFAGCSNFNQDLSSWNVSNCTEFNNAFENCSNFNQDLSNWDVSSGTTFIAMFKNSSFNNDGQSLNSWDMTSSNNISEIFRDSNFNQDITNWNISNCTNLSRAFQSCPFNQNISTWDVSSVTDFSNLFNSNSSFDQNIGAWDVSSGNNFEGIFFNTNFNNGGSSDINNWVFSTSISVNINGSSMFFLSSFNQPLNNWNTERFNRFTNMFRNNSSFNQDLSNWNVGNLSNAQNMFLNATLSTANYDALLIGWEAQAPNIQNNVGFHAGSSTYTLGGAAETARTNLINIYSWTITDGGGI